jgi:uroporphyrin-3 C-methyltransferase
MSAEPAGGAPAPAPVQPGDQASSPSPAPQSPRWRRLVDGARTRSTALALVAAAGLVLLAALWIDTRSRIHDLREQLATELGGAQAFNEQSRQSVEQAQAALRNLEYKVGMLESQMATTHNQRLALESLYLELSRSRDERVLAEVEQILLIGEQQLQLAGNVKSALIALENADARLSRADSTQFTELRRAIRRDIDRLKSAPFLDIVGMSLRLDTLAHQAETFPLAMYERPSEAAVAPSPKAGSEGTLTRLARETWADVRSLVRIQRVDSDEVPLVSPSQAFFLRENLRMRLLSARIALLAHDEAGFKADARSASDWLARYFDVKDKRVAAGLSVLKQLSDSDVSIDLPDISGSLQAVRNHKLIRERGLR